MNKLTVGILTAVITFSIGVALATAWVFNDIEEPPIAPVELKTDGPTMEMVFVLDTTGSVLMDYQAAGGRDGAENVRRALAEGVAKANGQISEINASSPSTPNSWNRYSFRSRSSPLIVRVRLTSADDDALP